MITSLNRKLGHIINSLDITSALMFTIDLINALDDYSHYIISTTPSKGYDYDTLWYLQSIGINVIFSDKLTQEQLAKEKLAGAICYNTTGMPDIGAIAPSIYYSLGNSDAGANCQLTVAASDVGIQAEEHGVNLAYHYVIPPGINTRSLRYFPKQDSAFIVGIITTGANGKYPGEFVIKFLALLDKDIPVAISTLNNYNHPGVPLALDARGKNGNLIKCPLKITAGLYYMARCDVLVYATPAAYTEVYSRTVVEAMAFGRPVICERKGCFPRLFEDKVNVLMFDTPEEAVDHVHRLRKDNNQRKSLALNGQLRASWEDISIHAGKFRNILRKIGI